MSVENLRKTGDSTSAKKTKEYESVSEFVKMLEDDEKRLPEHVHVAEDEIQRSVLDQGKKYGYYFLTMGSTGSYVELERVR